MLWAGENNVLLESVEEKNHCKAMGILSHHTPFDIANSYSSETKTPKCYIKNKTSKLTFQSLIIGEGHQTKRWVKYP